MVTPRNVATVAILYAVASHAIDSFAKYSELPSVKTTVLQTVAETIQEEGDNNE
jgi:hypothetical protein